MTEDERISVAKKIVEDLHDEGVSFLDVVAILSMGIMLAVQAVEHQLQGKVDLRRVFGQVIPMRRRQR